MHHCDFRGRILSLSHTTHAGRELLASGCVYKQKPQHFLWLAPSLGNREQITANGRVGPSAQMLYEVKLACVQLALLLGGQSKFTLMQILCTDLKILGTVQRKLKQSPTKQE